MISMEMLSIIGPAVLAGILIALIHAPLGIEVLKRGIIFIDLAIAQIAGLGFVFSSVMFHEPSQWLKQIIALCFAIFAGLFFRKVESVTPKFQEAVIGVSFVLASSLSILLLANHPHGIEIIRHLLSGQMLFITYENLLLHAPIYFFIMYVWFKKPLWKKGLGFYILFALAITSSVQLVGIYVVFVSLVLPALAVVNSKNPYKEAWSCSIISIFVGVILSTAIDAPAGPVIVVSYVVICSLISYLNRNKDFINLRNK